MTTPLALRKHFNFLQSYDQISIPDPNKNSAFPMSNLPSNHIAFPVSENMKKESMKPKNLLRKIIQNTPQKIDCDFFNEIQRNIEHVNKIIKEKQSLGKEKHTNFVDRGISTERKLIYVKCDNITPISSRCSRKPIKLSRSVTKSKHIHPVNNFNSASLSNNYFEPVISNQEVANSFGIQTSEQRPITCKSQKFKFLYEVPFSSQKQKIETFPIIPSYLNISPKNEINEECKPFPLENYRKIKSETSLKTLKPNKMPIKARKLSQDSKNMFSESNKYYLYNYSTDPKEKHIKNAELILLSEISKNTDATNKKSENNEHILMPTSPILMKFNTISSTTKNDNELKPMLCQNRIFTSSNKKQISRITKFYDKVNKIKEIKLKSLKLNFEEIS